MWTRRDDGVMSKCHYFKPDPRFSLDLTPASVLTPTNIVTPSKFPSLFISLSDGAVWWLFARNFIRAVLRLRRKANLEPDSGVSVKPDEVPQGFAPGAWMSPRRKKSPIRRSKRFGGQIEVKVRSDHPSIKNTRSGG
jgi:hypothetical protein